MSTSVDSDGYGDDEDHSVTYDECSENDGDNSWVESDDDDNDSTSEQLALWRRDPEESFSDWTIEISYKIEPANTIEDSDEYQVQADGRDDEKVSTNDERGHPHDEKQESKTKDGMAHNLERSSAHRRMKGVETITDTYHVHRCILASGTRKSGYFARLFRSGGRFAESKSRRSRISMDRLAAKYFPTLLDYIYYSQIVKTYNFDEEEDEECDEDDKSNSSKITLSPENVTALWWLAQYFEVPRLAREAKSYWQRDLGSLLQFVTGRRYKSREEVFWSGCVTYYEHARALQVEPAMQGVLAVMSTHLLHVPVEKVQLNFPDEGFWISLMDKIRSNSCLIDAMSDDVSLHLSKIFATHFRNCEASHETFQNLTQEMYLPRIHRQAAVLLLDLERVIRIAYGHDIFDDRQEKERSSIGTQTSPSRARNGKNQKELWVSSPKETGTTRQGEREALDCAQKEFESTPLIIENHKCSVSADTGVMTSLQRRCIQSIAEDWKNFDDLPENDFKALRIQHPLILMHTLVQFARTAEDEIDTLRTSIIMECLEYGCFVRAPNHCVLDPNMARRTRNDAVLPPGQKDHVSGWYIMEEDRLKYALYYFVPERSYEDPEAGSDEVKVGSDESWFTEGQRLRAKLVANLCFDPETRVIRSPPTGIEAIRGLLPTRRFVSASSDFQYGYADSVVLTGALCAFARFAKVYVNELKAELAAAKSKLKKFVRALSYSNVKQGRASLLVSSAVTFPPTESPSDGWCVFRGNRFYPLYYYSKDE